MKKTVSILILFIVLGTLGYGVYRVFLRPSLSDEVPAVEQNDTGVSATQIIAVGDSLTAGYGLPLAESYPAQLEERLLAEGYSVKVVNAGISGETTAGLLERVEFIKQNKPDIILITIGGNDALRNLPIEQTKNNITSIIQSFKEILPAEKIFLMQIRSPLNAGLVYAGKFNSMYEEISESEKVVLVPFVESRVFLNSAFMSGDGIHPNKEGYAFLVDKYIYPAVEKILE
ncbi:MAG: arylesterase [Candidatus Nomurabacteria bacterium]|nr:arylesterase [Candidatus Nomurabacteria bacterium]